MSNFITDKINKIVKLPTRQYVDLCEKYFDKSPDAFLLDVGCSYGNNLSLLMHHKGKKVAFDIISYSSQWKYKKNISFFIGDAQKIAIKGFVADAIIFKDVLEHLPNPHNALSEIARLMKPGGTLLISVPNDKSFAVIWTRPLKPLLKKRMHPYLHRIIKLITFHDEDHHREYNVDGIVKSLQVHGFKIDAIWLHDGLLPLHGLFGWNPLVLQIFLGKILPPILRSRIVVVVHCVHDDA